MEALLLSLHVIAGILFVGPVAVAVSLFPRFVPVLGPPDQSEPAEAKSVRVAAHLHRISRVYGALAVVVPVVGLVLAAVQGRLTEVWIIVAMVVTAIAGGLLMLQIVPRQREALASTVDRAGLRTVGMLAGVFNLLWVVVVILMIVRPGSDYS